MAVKVDRCCASSNADGFCGAWATVGNRPDQHWENLVQFASRIRWQLGLALPGILGYLACSSESPNPGDTTTYPANAAGAGGAGTVTASPGGGLGVGGTVLTASGGNVNGLGGATGTGGAVSNQGGGLGQGGVSPAGGRSQVGTGGKTSITAGASFAAGASATGGVLSVGGRATGGKSAGGATSGGNGSGGVGTTGGTAAGGAATGGKATGGASVGGAAATGGALTGGAATGGATSGGAGTTTLCPGASKTLTVAKDGTGQYTTVQAAINAVASGNSSLIQVSVKAGTYDEQVTINKPFVCLTGESATSTIITHTIDTSIVTGGTVLLTGNDFSAANITFQNSAPAESAQRVALMAKGSRQQFYNCRFISYQDTLYNNTGTQYFKNCYIQGNTDYIFGDATAVFDNCSIYSITQGTAVTAPRTPQGTTYGFVFIGGSLTASAATGTGRVHLGRPWGPYAAAAFINVSLGSHIIAAGWTTMSGNDLTNTRFWEYKSTGTGANTSNATRSTRQLSDAQAANYTVKNVLAPWVPGYSQ